MHKKQVFIFTYNVKRKCLDYQSIIWTSDFEWLVEHQEEQRWCWSKEVRTGHKGLKIYPSPSLSWVEPHRLDLYWPPVPLLSHPQFPLTERTKISIIWRGGPRTSSIGSHHASVRSKGQPYPPTLHTFNKNFPPKPHWHVSFSEDTCSHFSNAYCRLNKFTVLS